MGFSESLFGANLATIRSQTAAFSMLLRGDALRPYLAVYLLTERQWDAARIENSRHRHQCLLGSITVPEV